MNPESYELKMIDELCAITALQDTHVDCYACNPRLGYILVYHDTEGYYLIGSWQGFVKTGGPWDLEFTFEGFLDEVKLLGGER